MNSTGVWKTVDAWVWVTQDRVQWHFLQELWGCHCTEKGVKFLGDIMCLIDYTLAYFNRWRLSTGSHSKQCWETNIVLCLKGRNISALFITLTKQQCLSWRLSCKLVHLRDREANRRQETMTVPAEFKVTDEGFWEVHRCKRQLIGWWVKENAEKVGWANRDHPYHILKAVLPTIKLHAAQSSPNGQGY